MRSITEVQYNGHMPRSLRPIGERCQDQREQDEADHHPQPAGHERGHA